MTAPQPKRSRRSRRRKIFFVVLSLLLIVGAIGGFYVYRLVDSVVDAENAVVVPLPTRSSNFAQNTNPTLVPTVPAPTPTPGATSDGGYATASKTPTSPATDVATETQASAGNVTATSTPAPASEPTVTETVASTDGTTVSPTATSAAWVPLPTGDDPSHLDVLGDIFSAVGADDPGTSKVWGGKTDINILLLGVDRRSEGGDQNADVILIVHVDLINSRVAAVSIPRDLLVDIPGVGPDKINSAYNYGYQANPTDLASGVGKMRDTIESVFGVPIDGYVLIDFNGFVDVVDEMGGVDIDVPALIIDTEYPTEDYGTESVTFLPGMQHMNGETALIYVRTRHQDSDDGRRERQIQVLRALFDQAKSVGSLTNGFQIINALGDAVQTSFSLEQQLTLAKLGYGMTNGDITTAALTAPLISGGYISTGAWVYQGDLGAIREWITENLDTTTPPVSENVAGTGEVTPTPVP